MQQFNENVPFHKTRMYLPNPQPRLQYYKLLRSPMGPAIRPPRGRPVVLGLGEPPFRYLSPSPHPRYNFLSHGFDALSQLQHCRFACKDGSF
jgi:hypothetical protein